MASGRGGIVRFVDVCGEGMSLHRNKIRFLSRSVNYVRLRSLSLSLSIFAAAIATFSPLPSTNKDRLLQISLTILQRNYFYYKYIIDRSNQSLNYKHNIIIIIIPTSPQFLALKNTDFYKIHYNNPPAPARSLHFLLAPRYSTSVPRNNNSLLRCGFSATS